MQNMMGVINLINEKDQLEILTKHRCLASVPFGGRYRLIDFVLSCLVNSGIHNVSVFVHSKFRSLMDHLGAGKEWDLDRKRNGLFILPPDMDEVQEIIKGDLYQFYRQRDYFHRSTQEYVVITRSHMVCNVDFDHVLQSHIARNADITLLYKETASESSANTRKIRINSDGRVAEIQEHTGRLQSDLISMEMFILKKELLLDLVETSLAKGYDHFIRDAIMKNIDSLKIYGYEYKGYLGVINTLQNYYQHSMKLLNPANWSELFHKPGLIYTKIKDEPPTRYTEASEVSNSLVANGCVIDGKVENCILSRGVKVHKGAQVINSIILQNCEINENAYIKNCILDKDVVVTQDKVISGERAAPFVSMKRQVI